MVRVCWAVLIGAAEHVVEVSAEHVVEASHLLAEHVSEATHLRWQQTYNSTNPSSKSDLNLYDVFVIHADFSSHILLILEELEKLLLILALRF